MNKLLTRLVYAFADWLKAPAWVIALPGAFAFGGIAGIWISSPNYMNVLNFVLSDFTAFIAMILYVAGERRSTAMATQIEEMVRAQKDADNRLIGLENRDIEDIERVKAGIERDARA